MSTEKRSKINQLLASQPQGTVMQSFWLREQGYSLDLQKRYKKSNWLESLAPGALIRMYDNVTYEGGIHALQYQSGMSIHPGGKTALGMLGLSHYLEFSQKLVTLFGGGKEKLPSWFTSTDWGTTINYHATSFLPTEMGLTNISLKKFSIQISNETRAIMECLYLVPDEQDLVECFQFMESINKVRPIVVQKLLEACTSIKVKRLFLYLAEKANHSWLQHLDLEKIDLGKGKRSIVRMSLKCQ